MSPIAKKGTVPRSSMAAAPKNPSPDGEAPVEAVETTDTPELYEIPEATAIRVDQLNQHLQRVLSELNAKADEIARIFLEAKGVKLDKGDRVDFNVERTHIQVFRAKKGRNNKGKA